MLPFFLFKKPSIVLNYLLSPLSSRSNTVKKVGKMEGNAITKILFCSSHFPSAHEYTRECLQKYPFIQVDDVDIDDVPNVIGDYHICIPRMMRLDSEVISRAKQMKLIMQYGVGLEGVDIDAATMAGIRVARIPSNMTGNSFSCAEHAIYLVLGLLRKQKEMEIAVQERKLGWPAGETLFGKTVFILGYGNIGVDLAARLKPFGVKILATKRSWSSVSQDSRTHDGLDRNGKFNNGVVGKKGDMGSIYDFAGEADIVFACINLNKDTAGIVNHKFLTSMRKGALLVNVARGGVLDYQAVKYHLESGHLGGLAIDVAWTEPFDPEDPILKFPNVLITPHIAGVTEYSYRKMAKIVAESALQVHSGAPLTGIECVN
ncbi:uncharacterized protein LOC18448450 isoform X2 [Amborella trichopoda]|uniref:S-adenosyl-L-homocysteine hydrolase NAD binding domain-containing protein n=1 Tax=Amborella trichopoda TaxID=13333 RepID=U5DCW7_AMBTC|nr:uncharacterized protein LOC18448450 isoform X2 [Amborella trichopoda]ERN20040.1 hypothetical protein AMTR_s00071p00183090 [Amborella trichopoda]|eukprot:XP_020531760.1 uncharacterized protein LOC18448450 isoform X2 [Amborella trichopoda]